MYYNYTLQLKKDLTLYAQGQSIKLSQKNGLFLSIDSSVSSDSSDSSSKHHTYSEISPLPLFSKDTLEENIIRLQQILPEIQKITASVVSSNQKEINTHLQKLTLSIPEAALSWAIYCLTLPPIAPNQQLEDLPIACSELITLSDNLDERVALLLKKLHNSPEHPKNTVTIKIKLNAQLSPRKDSLRLIHIIKKFPKRVTFRLDGNRQFSVSQIKEYWQYLRNYRGQIQFFEEPCDSLEKHKILASQYIKIALDESLSLEKTQLKDTSWATVYVLKPTVLGAQKTLFWLEQAQQQDKKPCIFSSSYESALGIYNIARFAHIYSPKRAHGLNTAYIFSENFKNITDIQKRCPTKLIEN